MTEPELTSERALAGRVVAVSVSESADLETLGLTALHYDMALAELTRAVLLAGGRVIYGGRLGAGTRTEIMVKEAALYSADRVRLTLLQPASEVAGLSTAEFRSLRESLPSCVQLVSLDQTGDDLVPGEILSAVDPRTALSAMRRRLIRECDAQVVVGGKFTEYQGKMPGVLEEVLLALKFGKPLFVAGGFGGVAAAVCRAVGTDDFAWAPIGFPAHSEVDDFCQATLQATLRQHSPVYNGLDITAAAELAVSGRASVIASLVILGLSRLFGDAIATP